MAATTLVTLGAYAAFTFAVTARRTLIRKQQNQAENAAAQVFTDSMLNFETVKYFDFTKALQSPAPGRSLSPNPKP